MPTAWLRRLGLSVAGVALVLPGVVLGAPPPLSGTVTVTAKVCDPSTLPPAITSPVSGFTTGSATLAVAGTAGANVAITLYRNGISAGSAVSDGFGNWNLTISLVPGVNVLQAKSCLASAPVTVTYVPPVPPAPPGPAPLPPGPNPAPGVPLVTIAPNPAPPPAPVLPASMFALTSEAGIITIRRGEMAELPFAILGGTDPFAVSTAAGDGGAASVATRSRSLIFRHRYDMAGRYRISILAHDRSGQVAILETIAVVNNPVPAVPPRDRSIPTLIYILLLELLALASIFALWEYHLHKPQTRNTNE